MILINGQPEDRIDVRDRGLQYGDGVFETIAFCDQQLQFLNAHLDRLQRGSDRLKLGLTVDDIALIKSELQHVTVSLDSNAVIKVMITRGAAGRGYQYAADFSANRIISSHPAPDYPTSYQQGVKVRLCQQRLAINPQIAGIKHLNRLEQVLARNEWCDSAIAEGLMLDTGAHLIEGTMSNIMMFRDGALLTPALDNCGIEGVMRGVLLDLAKQQGWQIQQCQLTLDDLLQADECLLCNSVIGIWPIRQIDAMDRQWPHGPMIQKLQHLLAQAIMHR